MVKSRDDAGDETIRMGVRVCRYCRQRYAWPIGSKTAGCPRCQPELPFEVRFGETAAGK